MRLELFTNLLGLSLNPVFKLKGRLMEKIWFILFELHILLVEGRYLLKHHLPTRDKASPQKFVNTTTC